MQDLKNRTKCFALRIIKLSESLPKTTTGRNIANQIMRSGTSVAANLIKESKIKDLNNEANELTAMFVSILKTMNKKKGENKIR